MTAILAVVVVTVGVTARLRLLAYPLPVAWGLVGAFMAERNDAPAVAWAALGGAVVVVGAGLALVRAFRSRVDRPAV